MLGSPRLANTAFPLFSPADKQTDGIHLDVSRQSPSDLEVGGDLAGLPPGSTRYIPREELLTLPQVNLIVTDDANFTGPTKIGGVELSELIRRLGASSADNLIVAICDDKYSADYPRGYLLAHDPVLVLNINGKPPAGWPKDSHEHKYDMGPYMISHAKFVTSSTRISREDEAQIPWGVVRLEFRDEKSVFSAITPGGALARDADVQKGFQIAEEKCFHCHNAGSEGGQKSGVSWPALSVMALASPGDFMNYVRDPASKNPKGQMPGNRNYDDATLRALTAYFRSFSSKAKP